jgi:hypothetical protein
MHLVELMGGAQGGLKPTVVARRAMAERNCVHRALGAASALTALLRCSALSD